MPPPLTPDLATKYYRPETKQTNDGVDPRSESNVKSFPGTNADIISTVLHVQ